MARVLQIPDDQHAKAEQSSAIGRVLSFVYGLAAYLVFFGTILYAIGFVTGLVVPKTIDTGTVAPLAEAIVVNLLLMTLFAVQHSVMARKPFKQWWTQYVPKPVEPEELDERHSGRTLPPRRTSPRTRN